jgi:hypothetical protein
MAMRVQAATQAAVGSPGSSNYTEAKSHVTAQTSIRDTIEYPGFMDGWTDKEKQEVRGVLRAVPPDVDRNFMASLRDALDRNATIEFEWKKGEFDHPPPTIGDTAHLVLVTPDGRNFTGIRGFMRSVGIKNFPRPI